MSTLQEIETAAAKLPAPEKQELLLQLAKSLRTDRSKVLPPTRIFPREEIMGWIAEDEADMARFRASE